MTGTCGDTMRIGLKIESGVILDARYQVLGCPGAIASAMALVDLIKGKKITDAHKLNDGMFSGSWKISQTKRTIASSLP